MDDLEAKRLLAEQLAPYRARPYSELAQHVGDTYAFQAVGPSGVEYNVEILVVWDSPGKKVNIRVLGAVDDGRWPHWFHPLSDDFIMAPDGRFVGEGNGTVRVVDMIELHDSVVELRPESASVVLHLRPAYVHHWEDSGSGWTGTGRTQDARIEIGCRPESVTAVGPLDVSDGSLRLGDCQFDMVPVPLQGTDTVTVRLELVDGTCVTISGDSIRVELLGPATDVEPLPPEWAPAGDVG